MMCTDFCLWQHMRTFHASHSVLLNTDPLVKVQHVTFEGVGGRQAFISEVTTWAALRGDRSGESAVGGT